MKITKYGLSGYRAAFFLLFFAGVAVICFAQVDKSELEQNLPQIVFINFEGPYSRIDTREQIRQLGVVLGQQIYTGESVVTASLANMSIELRREYSYKLEAGSTNRYFVIHSVSAQEGAKIDADVFGLGVDTGVDHIRNLRTIIQGYLQNAYNYNENDAALLAEYITIYNAVYRGNWDYFSNRYKTPVMQNITKEKAGLSIRYDEWPGRTLILVPLGYGGISSIDTSIISDSRVVEEMRKEDDQGVRQRRDMVDLKEREAEQAEQRARIEREAIKDEEHKVNQERQEINQERQKAQDDQAAGIITKTEGEQKQEELNRREQAVADKEKELEGRREEAGRLEGFAEKKTDEAQKDREEIAKDQQAAIIEDTIGVIAVILDPKNPSMGRLIRINPTTKREIKRSPIATTYVRTVTFIGGRILAVAGENKGNSAVRLIELNQNNLEMAKQGDDDIVQGSLLWVSGNDLYAITADLSSKSCYLGRFDTNLALLAKSTEKLHPNAAVIINQGKIFTQSEDGSALILNAADLTVSK
jgi:hypothetical protein